MLRTIVLLQGYLWQPVSTGNTSKCFHRNDKRICYNVSEAKRKILLIADANVNWLDNNPSSFNHNNLVTDCRNMYNNGIREIQDHAFNRTKIDKLYFPSFLLSDWMMQAKFCLLTSLSLCSVTPHFIITGY